MSLAKERELSVIIPTYNEQDSIANVLDKWIKELNLLKVNYEIHVYNDGSKDNTIKILYDFCKKNNKIIVHNKVNSGHGPTILMGYRENYGTEWIFQIDSDDEMGPEAFKYFWDRRSGYDFLIGSRSNRKSSLPRQIISFISRAVVRMFYGEGVYDVNSPYRLIRTVKFRDVFNKIPENSFAPNVIISGMACLRKCRILEVPVAHSNRKQGEVSIKKWKLLKSALKSFLQCIAFRLHLEI